MTLKRLLCPTDFSPGAQHATRVAARIAAESGAELVVAHVWQPPRFTYGGADPFPAEVLRRIARERERGLAAAASQLAGFGVRSVTTRALAGVPWEQIVDVLAEDVALDLVVLGTHGRTGISRILLGSVTEKVVRHAPCSVLATRPRSNATSFGHVLCPVDFSDSSRRAVERAAELVAPAGAGIALLHVVELPVSYSAQPFTAELIHGLEQRSARVLEDWAAGLRSRVSVPVTTEIKFGSPAGQVLAVLDRDPSFDLVAVGCHGRIRLRRALIGSVAEQVTRHAHCCTMTAR